MNAEGKDYGSSTYENPEMLKKKKKTQTQNTAEFFG